VCHGREEAEKIERKEEEERGRKDKSPPTPISATPFFKTFYSINMNDVSNRILIPSRLSASPFLLLSTRRVNIDLESEILAPFVGGELVQTQLSEGLRVCRHFSTKVHRYPLNKVTNT
jgi:hypothetical protein